MNTFVGLIVLAIILLYFKLVVKKDEGLQNEEENTVNVKRFDPSRYEVRLTMMNSSERVFFETLRRAVADKFDIYPQVNLDKIFKVKYQPNRYLYMGAKSSIDKKSVDYLLVQRNTQRPAVAIELDGSSHGRQDRIERDEKVGSIFDYNGIPLIRFNVGDSFNESELRTKFERYF